MDFEEFKARYEKLLKKVAFNGTELQVPEEEIAKIYVGLIVLEENRYEQERKQLKQLKKRQIRER